MLIFHYECVEGGGGGQEKLYGPHRPILYSLKRGVRICFQNKNRTSKKKDITVFKKGRRGWYPLLKLHFKKNSRVFFIFFLSLRIYMGVACRVAAIYRG